MPYLTRRGRTPVEREAIAPYIEAPDDGAVTIAFGFQPLPCVDCEGVGTLTDDPSHRRTWLQVCQRCSAHWDVQEVPYYVVEDNSLVLDRGSEHHDIGFGGGLDVYRHIDERVSAKLGAPTHRAIVQSVPEAERMRHIELARQRWREGHGFFKGPYVRVPIPASWARRTRFHLVTTRWDHRQTEPEKMLEYFERLSLEQPSGDVWAIGAEATREWIALMGDGHGSQERVDALLANVRDDGERGVTMFLELGHAVARWARRAGWRVE
jgi:hypothetical protein